ncbi:MAG: pyridoxal-phosphate dependent enzyme [Dehalococcoidia bacterium]|jgi:threonine dehydratase|nr:pyridoxal-phosphate dependent enzyme [Dehalococcoidia bacterium]
MKATEADVTLSDIEAARGRIDELMHTTPVWPSRELSGRAGIAVMLKCENLQRTGSFKVRGAINMLATLQRPAGVVAASAGNHAQAVALATTTLGMAATVVVPAEGPLAKRRAAAAYGAELVVEDGPLALAIARAQELAAERGLVFVPPFDHPAIVAGQGTLGLELVEQAPDVETVLVPAGGGGLLAGVAVAVKALRPRARVIGVQSRAMPGIVASRDAGAVEAAPSTRTIAAGSPWRVLRS